MAVMQRWIIAAVVSVIVLVAGAGFGFRAYKQNRATRIWLPIPTRAELTIDQRRDAVALLKKKLGEDELLTKVSVDTGYARDMALADDAAGAADLRQRLFVEIGTADTPAGKVPSINVGFNCKVKEFDRMKKVTNRLMADIGVILGAPAASDDLSDEPGL